MEKRLTRVENGKMICGVCAGIGKYFNIDPTLVRLAFVVLGGVIYYAVMTVILWFKLDPNDLKLFTALIVAVFLAIPHFQAQLKNSFHKNKHPKDAPEKGGDHHA